MSSNEISRPRSDEVTAFVERLRGLPANPQPSGTGRLIFALDATASREPTWDLASQVQGEMFLEAARLGGLEVQLVFYRGFAECKSTGWVRDGQELVRLMRAVRCVAGRTQLHRVLRHAAAEARRRPVQALVFVGDCMEEKRRRARPARRRARPARRARLSVPGGPRPDRPSGRSVTSPS